MKQILQSYKSGELWLAEVPSPTCGSGGIVVQNRSSFVSAGTEKMLVDFAKKNIVGKALAMPDQVKKVVRKMKSEGIFTTLEKVQAKLDQPIPLGYSCAGIVEEVGQGLSHLSKGDRVACGGAGYANHAEYNSVPKNLVVKIPDNVSFEDASCTTVGTIAMQGVRQCDLRLGENVCIIGLGLLGILAGQMFKAAGNKVIGFDPNSDRCKLALEMGFDSSVNDNLVIACQEFSKGRGTDAVLITAAAKSNEPVTFAGEISRMKGTVVVTGMVGMNMPRDLYYKKELSFKLSLSYGPGRYDSEYEEAGHDYPYGYVRWTEQRNMSAFLDLVEEGKITPGRLITHRFNIDEALNAYKLLLGKIDEPYLGIVINYPQKQSASLLSEKTIQISSKGSTESKAVEHKPGIAFIGAGNFAQGVLLPNFNNIQSIRKKAICDSVSMTAEQVAKRFNFEYCTSDYDGILKDDTIKAVVIATRHNTHADLIIRALKAGKHVYTEKPLAINKEQLIKISDAVKSSPEQILTVGFNRRFSPHAAMLEQYFHNRTTPMIVNYRVNAGIIPADNWIHANDIGGGRIIGEACHFIDFIGFLIESEPVEVTAMAITTDNAQLKSDDNVAFSIKYKDGSMANIQYIALGTQEFTKERCEVYADESMAIMDDFRKTECKGKRGKKQLKGKQDKGFKKEIETFIGAVQGIYKPPIPLDSLFKTTAISFAVLESLTAKGTVRIS